MSKLDTVALWAKVISELCISLAFGLGFFWAIWADQQLELTIYIAAFWVAQSVRRPA